MKWSSQYTTILKGNMQEWIKNKGNKDGRTKLVKVVLQAIEEHHEVHLPEERLLPI
jgi:hypothetical protein